MEELSKAQRARNAIATYKTLADSLTLRGVYTPSGKTGRKLEDSLRQFSPEIYGSMSDPRIVELKGLEYVIDRLPTGIERCNKIVLTAQEELSNTSFKAIHPLKRRRVSYVVSEKEICFVVTRGTSEIYDILTHLTFLNIEAQKIYNQLYIRRGETSQEWYDLEKLVQSDERPEGPELDQALWNLSIILGRTYKETKSTYENLEKNRTEGYNNGLFSIIYGMGQRIYNEANGVDDLLTIFFTPSLQEILGHHKYGKLWAESIKKKLMELQLNERPVHVISANMHSFRNLLFGRGALAENGREVSPNCYDMIGQIVESEVDVGEYAQKYGFHCHEDHSGSSINVQIIDTLKLQPGSVHENVNVDWDHVKRKKPVLVVIDYAFGTQAYELMDELLCPYEDEKRIKKLDFESISIMGKAGILPGKKGDIMLATAHVMEGTPHNYILENDLKEIDFSDELNVFSGPMLTVLGTSLQNRDVLERFYISSWKAVGLEMEGGHYQRAINAAIIQGHIKKKVKVRYAYYASDNPLVSGETLASGPMGAEGIKPTYMISRIIIEKILNK